MSCDIELYNETFASAELARDITGRLIRRCGDANLRSVLAEQFAEYHSILMEAENAIIQSAEAPDSYGATMRKPIYCGMCLNLMIDSTNSHIAEMIIEGSVMGLVDTARSLNKHKEACLASRALAERLRTVEEANIRRLLTFL